MRRILDKQMVRQSVRCLPQLGLVYLNNPKAGCTTLKYSMWVAFEARTGRKTEKIRAHNRSGPFLSAFDDLQGVSGLETMTSFSVVRNPFIRTLSGYLNKVHNPVPGRTPNCYRLEVGKSFAARFGIAPGRSEVGFTNFLRMLESEPDELINHHFRPQYSNLLIPFSKPVFVGRLEAFGEVEEFLAGFDVPILQKHERSTGASGRLTEFYTDEAEAIVVRKFADDFRLFGYSTKVSEVKVLGEPQWQREGPDFLMEWLCNNNFPIDCFDPEARAHYEICAEPDGETQINRIRAIYDRESSWKHLEHYASIADKGDALLAEKIRERITRLRNSHRDHMQGDILVPPGSADAGRPAETRRSRNKSRRRKAAQSEQRAE